MTYEISIQNEHNFSVDGDRLQTAIETVLSQQGASDNSSVTVVITTNEAVQALNQQHRKIDAPTDVLSFPADPLPPELLDSDEQYLGDLVIAFPYAQAQSEREKHDLQDSLALLVVHGTLHLLGYDHDTPEHRAEMWAEQATALKALGIDEGIVPALESSDHA